MELYCSAKPSALRLPFTSMLPMLSNSEQPTQKPPPQCFRPCPKPWRKSACND